MPKDNLIERLRQIAGYTDVPLSDDNRRALRIAADALTRKQALIEEMVEGLEVYGDHLDRCKIYYGRGCDCGLAGLITKATND